MCYLCPSECNRQFVVAALTFSVTSASVPSNIHAIDSFLLNGYRLAADNYRIGRNTLTKQASIGLPRKCFSFHLVSLGMHQHMTTYKHKYDYI